MLGAMTVAEIAFTQMQSQYITNSLLQSELLTPSHTLNIHFVEIFEFNNFAQKLQQNIQDQLMFNWHFGH